MTLFLRLLGLALAEGNLGRTRQIVRQTLAPKGPTLEIPCGPGLLSDLFAGEDYVGCDPNRADVEVARTRRPGIFVCFAPDRIDVPSERFAQILAHGLFDHLTESRARASVCELARVTAEGGRLLVIGSLPGPRGALVHRLAARFADAGAGHAPAAVAGFLRPHFEVVSSSTYRSGFVWRVAVVATKARRAAS